MNIDKIIKKHIGCDVHPDVEDPLLYASEAKAAIKEIIEETLKLAAEEANKVQFDIDLETYKFTGWYTPSETYKKNQKESITNVINKIEGL